MDNPIKTLRQELNLSQSAFSLRFRVSPRAVERAENGTALRISDDVLTAVRKAGKDPDEVQREYESWREACSQEWQKETARAS